MAIASQRLRSVMKRDLGLMTMDFRMAAGLNIVSKLRLAHLLLEN